MHSSDGSSLTSKERHVILLLDLAHENPLPEARVRAQVPPGEPVTVLRPSELDAPRSRDGTPPSWPAATRALDRLVDRAREAERGGAEVRYWVAGRAGLPAFFYVGYLLTRKARVTLVNPRDDGPDDVLWLDRAREPEGAAAAYFEELAPAERAIRGPVRLCVAVASVKRIAPDQLPSPMPGISPITAFGAAHLQASNVGGAIRQLDELVASIEAMIAGPRTLAICVRGPVTLAFLVGRALNPTIFPDLDVLQFRDHHYELAFEIRRTRSTEIQTVLFVAADTLRTADLTLNREHEDIRAALAASKFRDLFELRPVLAAQPSALASAMRAHQPEVVHFCGHGTPGGLELRDDDDDRPRITSAEGLATLLGSADKSPRIVVLNACHSADQLAAVLAHAECCIGMVGGADDEAARRFAAALYAALGDGASVQQAFDTACATRDLRGAHLRLRDAVASLDRAGDPDRARLRPICVAREGVDPSGLVLVRGRR